MGKQRRPDPNLAVAKRDKPLAAYIKRDANREVLSAEILSSIGTEIRQVRRSKGVTIETVATRIGRSVAHISKLERGFAAPTVRDLFAISEALDVPVAWFLNERSPAPADEQGLIERGGAHRFYEQGGIWTEVLSPVLGTEIEIMRSVFQPNASTPRERSAHRKREDGYLLSGKLELCVDDKEFLLEAGDSYSYITDSLHCSYNPGPGPAVLLWVISQAKR